MSTYNSFAVAGAGNIGTIIVEELLKQKASGHANEVIVLTRKDSDNASLEALSAKGATIRVVDYASLSSLVFALKDVDVVVSCLGYAAVFDQQLNLAAASNMANVRLFIASQFGLPGRTGIPSDSELKEKLGEIEMSVFLDGAFADVLFKYADFAGLVLEKGKAVIPGDGNALISFTDRRDVGRYVAYVLTMLPQKSLGNREFRIEGQRVSLNSIVEEYQTKTGKTLDVTYIPTEDLENTVKTNPGDVVSAIRLAWATGKGIVGEEKNLSNFEYPEWNPKSVIDIVLS